MAQRVLPILFTPANAVAVRLGYKTVTRRLFDNAYMSYGDMGGDWAQEVHPARESGFVSWYWNPKFKGIAQLDHAMRSKAYYQHGAQTRYRPGDMLWVREAYAAPREFDHVAGRELPATLRFWYSDSPAHPDRGRMRSGYFMPRVATRTWLSVQDVTVERLSALTSDDAYREGISYALAPDAAREAYWALWDSLHGKEAHTACAADPWVARVVFSVFTHV